MNKKELGINPDHKSWVSLYFWDSLYMSKSSCCFYNKCKFDLVLSKKYKTNSCSYWTKSGRKSLFCLLSILPPPPPSRPFLFCYFCNLRRGEGVVFSLFYAYFIRFALYGQSTLQGLEIKKQNNSFLK